MDSAPAHSRLVVVLLLANGRRFLGGEALVFITSAPLNGLSARAKKNMGFLMLNAETMCCSCWMKGGLCFELFWKEKEEIFGTSRSLFQRKKRPNKSQIMKYLFVWLTKFFASRHGL
jgi:hypothetical protein